MNFTLTSAKESIEVAKTGGSLGCSNCSVVELVILRNMGLTKSSQDSEIQESELPAV